MREVDRGRGVAQKTGPMPFAAPVGYVVKQRPFLLRCGLRIVP